jgi:hypothetical protein
MRVQFCLEPASNIGGGAQNLKRWPPNVAEPWQWHISETFRGLVTLAVELLKMLALVNGGAAVALLAYLGNFAAHASSGEHPPHLIHALSWFASGLLVTTLTMVVAYLTQLRLYYEERARHLGEKFVTLHGYLLTIGLLLTVVSAVAFLEGCVTAAHSLAKVV